MGMVTATQANYQHTVHIDNAPHTTTAALGDLTSRDYPVQPFLMKVGVYESGVTIEFTCHRIKKDGTVGVATIEVYRSSFRAPKLPDWAAVIVEQIQKQRFEMITMWVSADE